MAGRGKQVGLFQVGQRVLIAGRRPGVIVRLHRSCRQGTAEIRPADGSRKVTRRLQFVTPAIGEEA